MKEFTLYLIFFISHQLSSQCVIYESSSQYTQSFTSSFDDDGPSVNDNDIVTVGGKLFFAADDGFSGSELWMIDDLSNEVLFVKDIYPGEMGSYPSQFTELNGMVFFTARSALGVELWTSDGTESGTQLIADIYEGSESSSPLELVVNNSTLYFTAIDANNNRELWMSDGTTAGTMMVKAISQGLVESNPRYLKPCGSDIYFSAQDELNGQELWKSDGTEMGTVLIKDIDSGSSSSNPYELTCINSQLYFTGSTAETGAELWKSDGTTTGTTLVKDIDPGSGSSFPREMTLFNNEIMFFATMPSGGMEIWKSDGTANGTTVITDVGSVSQNSYLRNLSPVGSKIVFLNNLSELWSSDGTLEGTQEIAPLNGTGFYLQNFSSIDDKIYFSGDDGELWVTDGTNTGTSRLTNLPGIADSNVGGMTKMGDNIYFVANDEITGYEMWRYNLIDGTAKLSKDINTIQKVDDLANLQETNGGFVFSETGNYSVNKLLEFDGNDVTEIIYSDDQLSFRNFLGEINGEYFFVGQESIYGQELWKTDGTESGLEFVRNIRPGTNGSSIKSSVVFDDKLYLNASDGIHGQELWQSDGTWDGTMMLKDIQSGAGDSNPRDFIVVGDNLFFGTYNGLYITDGTSNGTLSLLQGSITNLSTFGNLLICKRNSSELWISDGTLAGTQLVKDDIPGVIGSSPAEFVDFDNGVYFTVKLGSSYSLWKSDGTQNGTVLVSSEVGERPYELTVFNGDKLMFRSRTPEYDYGLWISDGTAAGTSFLEGDYATIPFNLTSFGNEVYFTGKNSNGVETIWSTDGTTDGTQVQWDLSACFCHSNYIHDLWVLMDELYFVAPVNGKGSIGLYKLNCSVSDCTSFRPNTWIGPTIGDWSKTPAYWEYGIPSFCDDVIILPNNVVTIKEDTPALSHTLDIRKGAVFNTVLNAELQVNK